MAKKISKARARTAGGRSAAGSKKAAPSGTESKPGAAAPTAPEGLELSHPEAPQLETPVVTRGPSEEPAAPQASESPFEPGAAARAQERTAPPIVGIGASAGGLEALEQFFGNVPDGSGMAFVIVQHLDPKHKGMMVELLQRSTRMPVVQVTDRLEVEPDHVYVIPPSQDMSILHGALHLLPQALPRGLNLPIDFFLRSLAQDQKERGIGVILSGMGSDGTLGLRAIKESAGATFVQAPASAKFDGMPRSAIDAGLADVVGPVEELPGKILAYRRHAPHISRGDSELDDKAQSSLEKIYVLLRAQTGNDFSLYKRSTIYRRIERRMGLHQIDSIVQYVRFLRDHPREIELLFNELLIGVTSFFRDPEAWEKLRESVLPTLLSARGSGGVLRAWVPGCSTGEEAYSLAMVFREAVEPFKASRNLTLQIFATDLDRDSIEKARRGRYPDNIAADVSPERLRRFFVQDERSYRIGKEIREMVVFAPQNVIMEPPFTKLDILSCRNLLIYLSAELQKKLIPLFHYSLNPGGVLFLGSAETVGAFSTMFAPLDGKTRLYRRLDQSLAAVPVDFPSSSALLPGAGVDVEPAQSAPARPVLPNLQALVEHALVQRFGPVGILCNDKGDIVFLSGRTGKYLEPVVGRANLNVLAMAREGLRHELSSAFSGSRREGRVARHGVKVGTNGGTQAIDLTVERLLEPRELRGTVLVTIADLAAGPPADKPASSRRLRPPQRLAELEQELQRAREQAQTTQEEMQTSQEELKSTNEELQSTNEELQSTNEELTTSKEEMQSLNEELQTVNHELQSKVEELSRSNNDMKNLLNSTDIATLFLDTELRVRRFTTPTAKIIKLIPGDAGRPITDIRCDLDYPELAQDAREVLRTLVFKERQAGSADGRWLLVRILPYRTLENVIDGVVITFTDASDTRALENALREQASQLRQMAESLPSLVWGCRPDGACDYLNRGWVEYTAISELEQLGYGWLEQVHPEDRERVREQWRASVKAGTDFNVEFRIRDAAGAYRWFKSRSVPIRSSSGEILKWYGTNTDVHDLKEVQIGRPGNGDRLEAALGSLSEGFLTFAADGQITFSNSAAARFLGSDREQVLGRHFGEAFPQLRGSALEQQLDHALRDGAPTSFALELDAVPSPGRYRVRCYPQPAPEGLSVLLERSSEREPALAPGEAQGRDERSRHAPSEGLPAPR